MKHLKKAVLVLLFLALMPGLSNAQEAFTGEIRMVGFNYAPEGWLLCQGQVLQISQYTALFTLLGVQFGGDGISTFALPDLRGRVPIGMGQGSGLTARTIGAKDGAESVTLTTAQMPQHNHSISADSNPGTTETPAVNTVPAKNSAGIPQYGTNLNTTFAANTVGTAGNNLPHNNMPPFSVVNYIICADGLWPVRP